MKQSSDLTALCSPARHTPEDYIRVVNSRIDLQNYLMNFCPAVARPSWDDMQVTLALLLQLSVELCFHTAVSQGCC